MANKVEPEQLRRCHIAVSALMYLNLLAALVLAALTTLCLAGWLFPHPEDHHAGMYQLLGACIFGVATFLFALVFASFRLDWRSKWALQAAPAIAILCLLWFTGVPF
jgi:hypothetical protein